ncbi:MAG: hypothetical protein WD078_02050 [Woeseia sp.]
MSGKLKKTLGVLLIVAGIALFTFGGAWAPRVLEMAAGLRSGAWLELFVPFLPMTVTVIGGVLLASAPARRNES